MATSSYRKHIGDIPLAKKALAFAIEKHAKQTRKTSELPYYVHPVEVWGIICKYKESVNIDVLGAAALLHDTLEDTNTTYEELLELFGPTVADIVKELTNDKDEIARIGKEAYLNTKLLKLSSYALAIKLADMLANVGENPTPAAIERIARHRHFLLTSGRALSSTHHALLHEIALTVSTLYGIE